MTATSGPILLANLLRFAGLLRALGFSRVDDLPGSQVPEVFRRFMRFGDVGTLPKVLEHNRHDLVSLAALLHPLAHAGCG